MVTLLSRNYTQNNDDATGGESALVLFDFYPWQQNHQNPYDQSLRQWSSQAYETKRELGVSAQPSE